MKKLLLILFFSISCLYTYPQHTKVVDNAKNNQVTQSKALLDNKKNEKCCDSVLKVYKQNFDNQIKKTQSDLHDVQVENEINRTKYESIINQYQQTNDRLNNYLTITGIVASIFGVLIALAGIFIGFESLKSQNRTKNAIKTLDEAKNYVNTKKVDFDTLIENKKSLLQDEYDKITKLLKDKLLNDIEIETSKVKEIAERKSLEIQNFSMESQQNSTIELLEKRLEFFENISIPDDPEILFSKAKILGKKKLHNEAIILMEKLVEIMPSHKEVYWYLGFENAQLRLHDKSIENYKKAIQNEPRSSSAYNNIALQYKAIGDFIGAIDCLNKAIEIDNKKELYYRNRIEVLEKLKSMGRVIEDYIQLISLDPNNVDYYENLISVLKTEKRENEIILYYDKAIEHFKESDLSVSNQFNFSKALFLGENGKEGEAIDILQNLIDKDFKIENCYIKIAELKNKLGKTEEAKSILNNGLANNPLSSILYIYKAYIEFSVDPKESRKTIDLGGEKINNEGFYNLSGRFFYEKNNEELGQYCYEGLIKIVENKIANENYNEGDLMNLYEASIIINKSLDEFNEKYRSSIVSEKYNIVLVIIDTLKKLREKFDETEKSNAIENIKKLNLEAKEKSLITWNFDDIRIFIEKLGNNELTIFTKNLIKYINKEINFEDL